jgi:hypothetical protein
LSEEVNPEKLDLITLIGSVKGVASLKDEKVNEINEHLLVEDFDDFLDKFDPKIYSYYNAANQKIAYTKEKPEGIPDDCISEISLNENNDFLKMLFTLIDAKKNQGAKNVDFKFENVLDMITPEKVMEDIKQVRKEIDYLYGKYDSLEDEDPQKLDIGDKLNIAFEKASQNYNNVLGMLPIAIQDIKTRLLLTGGAGEDEETQAIEAGMLTIGDDGELKIVEPESEAPEGEEGALQVQDEEVDKEGLIETFEEDYEAITENPTPYVKDLVVRTFAPVAEQETDIEVEKEVENYNNYLEFYKDAKDNFIETAKPLIEKLLGIKMFFDQYEAKDEEMPPKLLITNTKLDMMVKPNNRERLRTYLSTVNNKNNFENTIWYGIVPSVELDPASKMKARRERFKGTDKTNTVPGNTMESLASILEVAEDYKIQIFFNFQATEETTFTDMATKGVDKYIRKCEMFTNQSSGEYAIPCIPNFTVIPKNKSGVVLDKKMVEENGGARLSEKKEDELKLWLEGIYIDAAYVASGLVAAYQCPGYLSTNFRKVSNKFPGVRFDIEDGDNNLKVTANLPKEITGFTNEIKDDINRKNFGFVFSSDDAQLDGESITNIKVYKARSLAMTDNGFDSIYKTQVSTYIERLMRFKTSDFQHNKIAKFFSNNPASQKSKWLDNREYVNSVLQDGDNIDYEIDLETDMCMLNITFYGSVKNLEVEITKSTSDASA